jgi:hypothetical protein
MLFECLISCGTFTAKQNQRGFGILGLQCSISREILMSWEGGEKGEIIYFDHVRYFGTEKRSGE